MLDCAYKQCGFRFNKPSTALEPLRRRESRYVAILIMASVVAGVIGQAAEISSASVDERGFLSHKVTGTYQETDTEIKVLLPDDFSPDKVYRVLYVLPVESGAGTQFGHALDEIRRLGLHSKWSLVCVYPTFSQSSWYADNPLNLQISQESYFVKEVLPFIEEAYPVLSERRGRLLVGFSKSGWGAFSLLLRHMDTFEKAAAWDAPLAQTEPAQWRYFAQKFGTVENFQNYRIDLLLKKRAADLKNRAARLILMGYGGQRHLYVGTHDLMLCLGIPHAYLDGPERKHMWDSGWLPDAVRLLADGS